MGGLFSITRDSLYAVLRTAAEDDDAHVADKEEHIHPHLINKAVNKRMHANQHQNGDDDDDGMQPNGARSQLCCCTVL